MQQPLRIVLATGNPHKVEELRAILSHVAGVEVVGLGDVGVVTQEPEETGADFDENCAIKACSYAQQMGALCLADDSGLEVDALDGRPGVISSHYATDGKETGVSRAERDAANNARVLREMEGVEEAKRSARFVCVMKLAVPGGTGFQPVPKKALRDHAPTFLHRYRRNLPHWEIGGRTYFVTFRLREGELSPDERRIVLAACKHWHGERMLLDLVVVMPDHVHMLVSPLAKPNGEWWALAGLLQSIKGYSAKVINEHRGTSGAVWQDESHDRIVRDEDEFYEKWRYITFNPMRAGLVSRHGVYEFFEGGLGNGLKARSTVLMTTMGSFDGRIGVPPAVPRGANGFGYAPLFLVASDFLRTGAELPSDEKNARSHRAMAAKAMAAWIGANVGELLKLQA
jgi:non-canonical purine NTP pyrophosphatase (RdgB/HAM1 family)